MKIEEILKKPEIKILDGSILHNSDFLNNLYDCKYPEQLSIKEIEEEIEICSKERYFLSQANIFSIQEVAIERGNFSEKINQSYRWHFNQNNEFNGKKYASQKKKRKNFHGKIKKTFKDFEEDRKRDEKRVILLNRLVQENNKVVKSLERRNILSEFSDEQIKVYKVFVDYFIGVAQIEGMKRDFHQRHNGFKSKDKKDYLHTDEKLLSASCTLAQKQDIILMSSDSDMLRMMDYYIKDNPSNSFNCNKRVFIYADFQHTGDSGKIYSFPPK